MPKLKIAPLYVRIQDNLPGNITEVNINIGFSEPIHTSFSYGLVEEINFLTESVGKYVLGYTIGDEDYFVSLLDNKTCLTVAGGNGALHEAFLLMEDASTATALHISTPNSPPKASAYTVYRISEDEGRLYFDAILKMKI